jgi:hypothetical protein
MFLRTALGVYVRLQHIRRRISVYQTPLPTHNTAYRFSGGSTRLDEAVYIRYFSDLHFIGGIYTSNHKMASYKSFHKNRRICVSSEIENLQLLFSVC